MLSSAREEAAGLLERLGVPLEARRSPPHSSQFGRREVRSPITGEAIAAVSDTSAASASQKIGESSRAFQRGGGCRRRAAVNWSASSPSNCGPKRKPWTPGDA